MKINLRKGLILYSIILSAFFLLPNIVIAQTPPQDTPPIPEAPIDGGLSLLVAAGVGYGAKKLKEKRKEKKNK